MHTSNEFKLYREIINYSNYIRQYVVSDISNVQGVETYKTDNLKIWFNDDFKPWCLDGEKYDSTEHYYKIDTNKKVDMLIPNENVEKLFINK